MKLRRLQRFYSISLLVVLAASLYPFYMGLRVAGEMLRNGAVLAESYPKYIIPYTPIALAVVVGVAVMPIFQKYFLRRDFLWGATLSAGIFFVTERLMETKILVWTEEMVPLESWQMSLCYVPPEQYRTRTWQAVDVLLGGYSPAFKLHFYMIAVVLLLSLLNCLYGFAKMLLLEDYRRKNILILQGVTGSLFLGMCLWACFTSFYRTGELAVSALSAILMAVFFALLGVTVGVFIGSFTLGKSGKRAVLLPGLAAALTTAAMYGGEMFLLNGNLYRFGTGIFFDGISGLALAPVDLFIIGIAGVATALLCKIADPEKGCDHRDALS